MPPLIITEIVRRSEQGITRPFFCHADDGSAYVVKTANAGNKALIAEWLAGSLGRELGLPIPPFAIAELPPAMLAVLSSDWRRDWGTGPVFASRTVDQVVEFRFSDAARVPPDQQALLLLFDAWIGNGDRTLGIKGGNPNLLWSDVDSSLHVIDHNVAFEDSLESVKAEHVFASAISHWDLLFPCIWSPRLVAAAAKLELFWSQLPDEWVEGAAGFISLETVKERLRLLNDPADTAWGTL